MTGLVGFTAPIPDQDSRSSNTKENHIDDPVFIMNKRRLSRSEMVGTDVLSMPCMQFIFLRLEGRMVIERNMDSLHCSAVLFISTSSVQIRTCLANAAAALIT